MKGNGPPDEQAIRQALAAGMAHHDAGRLAQAEEAYRGVLAVAPERPDAWVLLGAAAQAGGRLDEAAAAFRRAAASAPRYMPAWFNLASALEEQGRIDEAVAAFRAALEIEDRPALRARFAHAVAHAGRLPEDPAFRALVTRAISEAWTRPADLAGAAIRLVAAVSPARAPIDAQALSRDGLLLALLDNAQACDPDFERFLTRARLALLEAAEVREDDAGAQAGLPFFCALARQCFLNDYVFSAIDEESARAASLREKLATRIQAGAGIPAVQVAAAAAYAPLHVLPSAASLLDRPWPEAVRALLAQQVAEPRTESELRAGIARWTAVDDDVSRRVRRQYEENPYPRWVKSPVREAIPLGVHLRLLFPHAPLDPAPPDGPIDLLVAGCGTGQEPVDLARQIAGARIAAVDLSLASLAYAKRKSAELGLAGIEYAQADILALGALGRAFDAISSVGVLHHLADPAAGWRTLASLLRPGGFMQVGLYSERGRRDLAAARELIAARGFEATPEGIRRCRRELLESGEFPRVTRLRDFYGMNECRDLLFHVEEHRFTLPDVERMVRALGLEVVGVVVEPAVRHAYRRRFPGDAAEANLAHWHAFETEFPDVFAGMYLFWVRKPAAG